jgi:pimeloyl-ACP methyl ester carboxylesterase
MSTITQMKYEPDAHAHSHHDQLEVLSALPKSKSPRSSPLLFVHGAYSGAWCWKENFLSFFADAGFPSYAVSLSGHGKSRGRKMLDHLSIDDYVRDVEEAASGLRSPPVLIGHSMGGFVVQKALERRIAPAAVLMCAVPPQGLMASAVGLMFSKPALMSELNKMMSGSGASRKALKEALFAQPVSDEDLNRYFHLSQLESHRALWDMAMFNLPQTHRIKKTPLKIIGAQKDHLILPSLVEMTARSYGTDAEIFAGMGHGLMLERDWKLPAQSILNYLHSLGL